MSITNYPSSIVIMVSKQNKQTLLANVMHAPVGILSGLPAVRVIPFISLWRLFLSALGRKQAYRFLFVLLPLITSCRQDLCYIHDEHSLSVKIDALTTWELEWERPYDCNWIEDWEEHWPKTYDEMRPEVPEGVRVVAYDNDGTTPIGETNLAPDGGRILSLPEGTHDLLFYNNDTEYIVFAGTDMISFASATTRTLTRGGFEPLHEGERTVNQPDMLFGHYVGHYEAEKTLDPSLLDIEMRPLVYTYVVCYEFTRGLEHVALARGALAGMAESVYLTDGHTGDETVTVLFDCKLTSLGAEAEITSFGVPNYPGHHYTRADGTPARYSLNLEVRLNNGKYKTFNFDITDQVEQQPRGGIIYVEGLEVEDDEASGGDSGFVPDVEGWGDYHDIEMPLS